MIEFDATDVGRGARLALSATEASYLAPDHPFLLVGRWRGFGVERDGALVARLVASVDPRQRGRAGPIGCLGFVWLRAEGDSEAPMEDPARQVIAAGARWLQSESVTTIRCPVQLSTWYGHRATIDGFPDEGGVPPFPLEPPADRALPALLGSAGFTSAHRAVSCLVDSSVVVEQTEPVIARLAATGLRDRPIELADLDEELHLVHRLSTEVFRDAWGISEATFDEFASIYRPLARGADDQLIRILHDGDGRPVGFALGYAADPGADASAEAGRGRSRVFVLKSLGVTADARRRHPGLGAALAGMVHRVALERGYDAGMHALMTAGSAAHRISMHWGHPVRSYATFERGAT